LLALVLEARNDRRQGAPVLQPEGGTPMKISALALMLLGLAATSAAAVDIKDLAPCLPAAARFCDRSGEMTWSNLVRCGTALAAHSFQVGNACRVVLRRYGAL
jgi:hypothetical protein